MALVLSIEGTLFCSQIFVKNFGGQERGKDEALAQGQMGKCEDGSGGGECRQTQAFHSDPWEA